MKRNILILLHSSKTMLPTTPSTPQTVPILQDSADTLIGAIANLRSDELGKAMHISAQKQIVVQRMYRSLQDTTIMPVSAVESFRGDIYSGLRALQFTSTEKTYAQANLRILSGLYGVLRPYDALKPYRLEAATRLPTIGLESLYQFWEPLVAATLPRADLLINLTSKEYQKLLSKPLIENAISPRFLTIHPKTNQATPVTVHAKIARGAYARWLIQKQPDEFDPTRFTDLGYQYDAVLSTMLVPVYICKVFGGIGLSQRLAL